MKTKIFEVYKITNKINGKLYVGITNQTYKVRWYKHCSDAIRNCEFPLHAAIRKYGTDNFKIEVLEICTTLENLKERECFWITELKSRTTENGYNLTSGGDGTFGRKQSIETRNKISKKKLGVKLSEELKEIMRHNSTSRKEVRMIDLNGIEIKVFPSCAEASREVSVTRTNIAKAARKGNVCAGYRWEYTGKANISEKRFYLNPIQKEKSIKIMSAEVRKRISETNKLRWTPERRIKQSVNNIKNRVILQFDLAGNFIQEFNNISSAVKAVGASTHTNISKCARGLRKKAAGFIWKYKDN